ncbi:MAG: hypothetical protein EA392_04780 [Cryomorphaceae bacterium]|nr:MAG: hypothetical protein EA392_04780 [Cryomorphaceae bacterium]
MKQQLLTLIKTSMLTFVGLLLFGTLSAQDVRLANLTPEGFIELNANDEPDGHFIIDVSHMSFESPAEMTQYFQARCCENFLLRGMPSEGKVLLVVKGNNKPNWDVAAWNAHFAERLEENPIGE